MALITVATKDEFKQKVLENDKPVLVDFWAEWCPPCVAMTPVLKSIVEDLEGKADIVKVNIEESAENQSLAAEYGVQSIPNLVFFKSGKEADRIIGMARGTALHEKLTTLAQ